MTPFRSILALFLPAALTGAAMARQAGSADGRWIAATAQKPMKGSSRYARDLFLWRLDPSPTPK
ncbi:MAG: hypothetical protein IT436_18120 [Phycisphaerales bacterium]|nr:hypothetical protein [Phycisphaerales bacterium]